MKKVILAFSTMFALATASFAQNAPAAQAPAKAKEHGKEMKQHPKEMGEQGQMGASLGLSADQQTKYAAVNKAHQEAVRKVEMDKTVAPDAKKTQVAALKSKYETDIKGVMNAEQYAKWSAARAKRAENKAAEKMGDHKMGDKKPKAKTDATQPQGASKSN